MGLLGAIILAVQVFSFYINRHLEPSAQAWDLFISQQWGLYIYFESIHYHFPNRIVFKNLLVHTTDKNKKIPLVAVARMDITLEPNLKNIISQNLIINLEGLKQYVKGHPGSLDILLKALPKEKIHLLLKNKQFNIDAILGAQHIDAKGFWRQGHDPYNYELSSQISYKGINVNNLVIKNKDMSLDLWGRWQDNTVDWKGFIFYKEFYILDINGRVHVKDHIMDLDHLNFTVNGDTVNVQGQCSKEHVYTCHADLNLSRQEQHQTRDTPLKDMRLHVDMKNTPYGLVFNGATDLNFLEFPQSSFDWQSAHLDFKNLEARLINANLLRLKTKNLHMSWVDDQEHKLPIDDLLSSIYWQAPYASIALSIKMYQGHAQGHFFVDTHASPWAVHGEGSLNDLDMGLLNNTYAILKQCQGHLWSHFNLLSLKDWKLTSHIVIHQGGFDDGHFLPWLSETFQIPGLQPMSGIDLSCNVAIDGHAKMFNHLKMHTHDIDLTGFFDMNEEELVSSQMALRLSQKLLNTFPIGRKLMGLVENAWDFPFEFRLSGNVHRMNFQWEESPLKTKVSQHIFGFVQRAIDRHMNTQTYPVAETN